MKHKVLVLGKGFIGNRLKESIGAEVSDGKINSFQDAQGQIKKFSPDVIINCVGYTGRNVDECELDKDKTLMANSFLPIILAEAALRNNIRFVHISSGCIYQYDYSKDQPITEERTPDFFDLFYSRSKIYSEQPLEILSKKYPFLILRIRIPLDNRPHPKNILTKLLSYKKVIDIPNSVTYIPDFINALKHLLRIGATGLYNVVNKGGLAYSALLDVYKQYDSNFQYEVINAANLNLVRTNLILSTEKLEKTGFKVRGVKEVLEECVKGYLNF